MIGCACDPRFIENDKICDEASGKCFCKAAFTGDNCSSCANGFFNFPNCMSKFRVLFI